MFCKVILIMRLTCQVFALLSAEGYWEDFFSAQIQAKKCSFFCASVHVLNLIQTNQMQYSIAV